MCFESFLTYYLDCHKNILTDYSLPTLDELKKDYISYLLELTDHDTHAVADILHLPPKTLCLKLNQYNLLL
jgi:DNA-binding NtrC family response regulator